MDQIVFTEDPRPKQEVTEQVVQAMKGVLDSLSTPKDRQDALMLMMNFGYHFMAKDHGPEFVIGWFEGAIADLKGEQHPALNSDAAHQH